MSIFRADLLLGLMVFGLCSCQTRKMPAQPVNHREITAHGITFSISIPPKIPEKQLAPLDIKVGNDNAYPVKYQLCQTELRLRSNGTFVKPKERIHKWVRFWDSDKPIYQSVSEMAALERYGGPVILIRPQQTESRVIDLLENYELPPGRYTVEVKRWFETVSSQGTIATNLEAGDLKFEVVQAK